MIGDGGFGIACGGDDLAQARLIGLRHAFLLIQRAPGGFGHFQQHAFNITAKPGLEIEHPAAPSLAEEIEPKLGVGHEPRSHRAQR